MANLPTSNNNPGDLKFVGQENATEGAGGFAKFDDPKKGYGALLNDLNAKMTSHPDWTLGDFSNHYAPPSDNNDTAQYTANLANQLKVPPNTTIGNLRGRIGNLADAVAHNEGYHAINQTPQTSSGSGNDSGGPDLLSVLGGLGAGALGWLGSNLRNVGGSFIKHAAVDVPVSVGIGALGGSVIPGAGTAAGGLVGVGGGLLEAGGQTIEDLLSGKMGNNQPPTDTVGATQNPQEQPQSNFQTDFAQSAAASNTIKDAIMQTMQGNKSDRVYSNSDKGQNAINTAAQFGLINPDENGNLIFDEERAKQAEAQINNLDDKIIEAEGGRGAMMSVSNHAGNYIGGASQFTDLDRQKAAKIVQENLEATGTPINGQMDLTAMRERQKQHYQAANKGYGKGLTTPEILAHKALGNAYGETIGQHLQNPELHKKALGMEKDLIQVRELGKKIQGKRPPKANGMWEMFLRQGARAAEIYIGDKIGGPIGAIIGGLAGEHLNNKINQKYGRNIFETKQMRAAMDVLHEAKPKEYVQLVEALKKQGIPFTPEKEPENENVQEKVKDVKGDLRAIGAKKGLVSTKKKPKKGLVKRKLRQNNAELIENA